MRPRNWPVRLEHCIEETRYEDYETEKDLVLWACKCFKSISTEDYEERALEGFRETKVMGDVILLILKENEGIPILMAQRGDAILLWSDGRGSTLGILSLDGKTVFSMSVEGMLFTPLADAIKAWRVG